MTRSPLASLASLILLASAAGVAGAGNTIATGAASEAPQPRRLEGRVGVMLGGSDVGDADGFSVGVTTGLGYRIGDVTLRARFDHYRTGDGPDEARGRKGRGTRVGGAVRYSFASTVDHHERAGVGIDFWGEAGLGLEHVTWRQGGVYDRPSGEVAIGFELDGYGKRDAKYRRRHIGYFMAFRSFIARGPETDGPAVCGGPCTMATKPSRNDISMFFELGLHWGK
ncbi:MAG: hypothetical protein KF773_14945 [Deltaproteobacteria bacterium]|nr:hypothetical protein [Deltaproteobacteria bacterium]